MITLTPSEYSDEGYRRGYVEPVQVLANIYAENPLKAPKLVLFVSSSGVYAHDDGVWVDEGSSTESQRYNGKRLLEAEQLLAGSAIPSIAVRFSGIYGPGRNRLIKQAREKVWSETDQSKWTNRIHVDDCAGVLAHLIERYQQGKNLDSIYLASDSEPVSSWDVKQWLAQQQDAIEEQELSHYSGVMSNKRCSNQRLLDSGYEFIYPSYREGYRQVLNEN